MLSNDVLQTTWTVSSNARVKASAEVIYKVVADVPRVREWSPECRGAHWTSETPGSVGATFEGYNADEHAQWTSESKVLKADPAREFVFSVIRFRTGGRDDSAEFGPSASDGDMTWGFSIRPDGDGCILTQTHTMNKVSSFFEQILGNVEDPALFLFNRKAQLENQMVESLENVRKIAERDQGC